MEFRDLKRQYEAQRGEVNEAIQKVLTSGTFIGGEPVSSFENALAEYVGVKHAISCANGTDALTLALNVWGIGPGDAVFVPDFTFFASAETIAAEGAMPVFVDVCEDTYNIDPSDLGCKIDAVLQGGVYRPRAVVCVDLFGLPAEYDRIRPLADKYKLLILEDGAQGFGGSVCGTEGEKMACSFGDISTTSFFPAKPLGCYGDGGAVFTDNDEWAGIVSSLKVHGKGSCKYDNVRIGMNSRLDTLQAAILQVKLDAFRQCELSAVRRVAELYSERLDGMVGLPLVSKGCKSSWAQYTIRIRDRESRDALKLFLSERGIPSNIYYPAGMHAQSAFSALPQFGLCPVSDSLCSRVLSLPIHPYMTEDEVDKVAGAVVSFFN